MFYGEGVNLESRLKVRIDSASSHLKFHLESGRFVPNLLYQEF